MKRNPSEAPNISEGRRGITPLKLFRLLHDAGVPVLPFGAGTHAIADIGLPASISAAPYAPRAKTHFQTLVSRYSDIAPALTHAYAHSPLVMVQEHIMGREIACGVLMHEGALMPLMPVDMIPRPRGEAAMAHMHEKETEKIKRHALRAHETLFGRTAYSCVRFALTEKDMYVTGVSYAPPLLPHSAFAESARAVGFTLPELKNEIKQ